VIGAFTSTWVKAIVLVSPPAKVRVIVDSIDVFWSSHSSIFVTPCWICLRFGTSSRRHVPGRAPSSVAVMAKCLRSSAGVLSTKYFCTRSWLWRMSFVSCSLRSGQRKRSVVASIRSSFFSGFV
jgi:hypothetical protein